MIKKTKDAYKQIAEIIQKALDYNKNLEEGYTPIKLTTLEISRGLYNTIIKNGIVMCVYHVCQELGIENCNEAPFEIILYDNDDYCQLYINYK